MYNPTPNYPFIEFEIALLAKQFGYDEYSQFWYEYYNHHSTFRTDWNSKRNYECCERLYPGENKHIFLAPTYQELIDWFREKFNIYIEVLPAEFINDPAKTIFKAKWFKNEWKILGDFGDYYEALIFAIEEAFEELKKK